MSLRKKITTKKWHFLSFEDDRILFSLGVVHIGLGSLLFLTLYDKVKGTFKKFKKTSVGFGAVQFSEDSTKGKITWRSGKQWVIIENNASDIKAYGFLKKVRFELTQIRHPDPFHFQMNFNERRWGKTHKEMTNTAFGQLIWEGKTYALAKEKTVGTSDWSFGQYPRPTIWKWASFHHRDQDQRLRGVNLSTDIYESGGHSPENLVFEGSEGKEKNSHTYVDFNLEGGKFELSGGDTALRFRPLALFSHKLYTGIVNINFKQWIGRYEGQLAQQSGEPLAIETYGILEDHRAYWI